MGLIEHVDQLRRHWWWRSGWRDGRHFYACHITLDDQPELCDLAAAYEAALSGVDGLDLIPARWLHLTLQGIGFVDEVPPDDIDAITRAIADSVAVVPPPTLTFHDVVVRPEAVYLPATPPEPLRELRTTVRDAIAHTIGDARTPNSGETFSRYRPHVSVAYVNRDQPAAPIVAALRDVQPEPVRATFGRLAVLEFHRDHEMYEWIASTPIPLARAG